MIDNPINYWDTFDTPYQMGSQKHRVYMLDKLKEYGVKTLLDIGCGTGPIYQLLTEADEGRWDNIIKYKGTDYSRGMIEVCKKEFPNANWEVEDARHLTEPDNSWDCVLIMHCLDHLDNYQAAIREAVRVAKKYVVIILWRSFISNVEGDRLNDRNMMNKEAGEKPWEDTFLHEYSEKVLLDEFAKNNLFIRHETCGEEINDPGKYNYLWILEKEQNDKPV